MEMADLSTRLTANEDVVDDVSIKSGIMTRRGRIRNILRDNAFLISLFSCVVLGFLVGFGLRELGQLSEPALMWIGESLTP